MSLGIEHAAATAAFAVIGWYIKKFLKDFTGLSRKINKIVALLYEWDGLEEKQRRAKLSAILEGK